MYITLRLHRKVVSITRKVTSLGDTVTIAENGGSDVQPTRVY
jgi:hypothetical protein